MQRGVIAHDAGGGAGGAHGAVAAEPVEHGAQDVVRLGEGRLVHGEGQVGDVVVDADRRLAPRAVPGQLLEHRRRHRGGELLRRQPVADADHPRHALGSFRERCQDVEPQGLAQRARLLRPVEDRDRTHRRRQAGEERRTVEGTVQPDLDEPDPLPTPHQPVDRSAYRRPAGTHDHYDSVGFRVTVVLEDPVRSAGRGGQLVHRTLDGPRDRRVVGVGRLAALEEGVGVLRGAADHRMVRRQRAAAMRVDGPVGQQAGQGRVIEQRDLVQLVRGAEAIEEVQERNTGVQRGRMRDRGEVVRLLRRRRGEHGEAGRPRGHHVTVVTEDRQGLGGHGPGGHMEHHRRELAGDLEHVRQHQQEPLRRGEGGGQCTRLQSTVDGAGGTALAL